MENKNYNIALNFHEITKHSYFSVRTSKHYLDWNNYPYLFKVYLDLEKIKLPLEFEKPKKNSLDSLIPIDINKESKYELNLKKISEILFFSYGITREKKYFDETFYFRAAPATGALYSTEIYIICKDLYDLSAGVYHFDPGEFVLTKLRSGDYRDYLREATGNNPFVYKSPITIVFTSIGFRNSWKYHIRSYRHWYWDSGAVCANLLAILSSEDIPAYVSLGFVDKIINKILGIDGINEVSLALVSLGPFNYELKEKPELEEINPKILPIAKKMIIYEEIKKIHESSCLHNEDEVVEWRNQSNKFIEEYEKSSISYPLKVTTSNLPLFEVILKRGSTRRFSLKPINYEHLSTILEYSTKGIYADFLQNRNTSLIKIFMIVNNVNGLESGAYFYNKNDKSLELIKKGKFREVARYLCLEQELGYQASVVFFLMSDLKRVLEIFGNRGYRACQFEAGIIAGKIYLSAYSLDLGATGLTFYDDDITEFFKPFSKDLNCMMVVAVGIPAYKAKPGKIIVGRIKHKT